MRKTISLLLVAVIIASSFIVGAIPASAATGTIGKIKWTVKDNTLTVSRASGVSGKVEIADYSTTIHPAWYKHKDSIKNVIINSNITKLGKFAFYGLTKAKTVTIGKDVATIDMGCFGYENSLTNFILTAGNSAFKVESGILLTANKRELVSYPSSRNVSKNAEGVKEYIIPSSVTTVRAYSFYHNQYIEKITNNSPGSVLSINSHAFGCCEALKTVVIKNNCKTIENKVFYGSKNLRTITIPPSVTSIGTDVFSKASDLKGTLRIHCARNSTAHNKFVGKGYILTFQTWDFNVTFNPNGGTCAEKSKAVKWGESYGTLPSAEKFGYNFDGWYLGNTKITSTSKVTTASSHTLTANYIGKEYKVSLDAQEGFCDTESITVEYGKPFGTLPTVTKAGYTFTGWYTQNGVRIYTDTVYTDESITTLVARFIKDVSAVTGIKIKYKSKTSVNLSWDKQPEISGYEVYVKKGSDGYALQTTTTNHSVVINKLLKSKNYRFKVRGYSSDGEIIKYGSYSEVVLRPNTFLGKPKLKLTYKKKSGLLKVRWKSVKTASKYQIYQRKNKKWKKVRTTTATSFFLYTKKHKTYSFKVRAMKTVMKHKIYSKYAKVKKKK